MNLTQALKYFSTLSEAKSFNYMVAKVFNFLLALLQGNCAFSTCSKNNKSQKTNLYIPVKVNVPHVSMPHLHIQDSRSLNL